MDVIYNLQGAVCLLIRSSVWKFPVSPKYPCVGTPVRCPVLFWTCTKKGARPYRGRKHRRYGHALLRRNDFQLSVSMVLEPYIPGMAGVDSPEGERPRRPVGHRVSKAGHTWDDGSRAKRTKPATPHRRLRSLNRKLCFHRVVLRRAGQTLRAHEPTRSCLINLLGSLNLPTK